MAISIPEFSGRDGAGEAVFDIDPRQQCVTNIDVGEIQNVVAGLASPAICKLWISVH